MSILKLIFSNIIKLWSFFYTLSVHQWLMQLSDGFYTMWVRNFMGEVGKKTRFSRPLLLQGGGQKRIKIGCNSKFASHCVLGAWICYGVSDMFEPEIIIGESCSFGEYCHITAIRKITIGDGLLTGRFVYIGDNSHGGLSWEEATIPPAKRHLLSKGEIKIGNNVWIGDKVSILGGVTIGDNVIIGAGTIVTHDIPSNSIAAGIPVRILKKL